MRVGIIGTGLIGASIALACRERGDRVIGFDRDGAAVQHALAMGALDAAAAIDEIYAESDVAVIAVPLDAAIVEVRALHGRRFRRETLVIDVASVKAPVEEAGRGVAAFVPTHPLAGGESSGPAAARASLFEQRSWCYTPTADIARTQAAHAFIARLGAQPFALDASEHDRIVAATSHLPQRVAFAFKRVLRELESTCDPETVGALCGPVARELLRIAGSSAAMWDPIFAANAGPIADAMAALVSELDG